MTIASDVDRSGPYSGNGVTTAFDYDFRITNEAHVRVVRGNADNTETTLVLGADYSVTGVGDAGGGQIICTSAPSSTQTITLLRDVPFVQETDLENQGAYLAQVIEDALDLAVMRDQQLKEGVDRAHKAPFGEEGSTFSASDVRNAHTNAAAAAASAAAADAAADDAADSAAEAAATVSGKVAKAGDRMTGELELYMGEDAGNVLLAQGRMLPKVGQYLSYLAGRTYTTVSTFFTQPVVTLEANEIHSAAARGSKGSLWATVKGATTALARLTWDDDGIRGRVAGGSFDHIMTSPIAWGASESASATDNSTVFTKMLAQITDRIDGQGKIFSVTSLPDISRFKRIGFKVGSVIHMSKDFIRGIRTSKITNGMKYTAWAQDKAYMVGKQIRMWVLEKESHPDGTGRIVLYVSDDNGSTFWPGEYLQVEAKGETLWSAGFDAATGNEYLFVRVPAGATDVPPYTYTMWKRTLTLGAGTGNYYAPFTKTPITFPVPAGATGQPVMIHSFTIGHGGSVVVGASYGEGAWVMRSTDGGITWTAFEIGVDPDLEEPTVVYDPVTTRYYGFCRNGGSGNPVFWYSPVNDLTGILRFTAPAGSFGANSLTDAPVPLKIYNGRIYAFTAFRNGTLEGSGDDELTSAFFLDFPVFAGNVWTQPSSKIYRLGTIPHREGSAGASACGQGSVVMVGSRVHLYFGMEERTGTTPDRNRIANIYQVSIPLTEYSGAFDFRDDLADNRGYLGPLYKGPENQGWFLYMDDASDNVPARVGGCPNFARHASTLTIASGVLTITPNHGYYVIDTEGAAASDDLDKITVAGRIVGDCIILQTASSARDVTIKHNSVGGVEGAVYLNGQTDKLLSSGFDNISLTLALAGSTKVWKQMTFNDNAV
ncbi:hypothetical protein CN187_09160 [Sinorhizobium meliloti]|uniref:hypothetical protein n=1 Tax=Rhizobium meliloti TaxID=382 RepID=UPI000FDC9E6F|nr:hypothetical protein [Sinorhizobium meliloti]RVI69356.1 hypothetical protein CN187_09160 [Sinorhizobium meliloti]